MEIQFHRTRSVFLGEHKTTVGFLLKDNMNDVTALKDSCCRFSVFAPSAVKSTHI